LVNVEPAFRNPKSQYRNPRRPPSSISTLHPQCGTAGTHQVVWYENLGQGTEWKTHVIGPLPIWKKQVLKEAWRRANQIILFDADGDKRLDLAATAERGTNELRLWRNLGP
jgi:hypothetical protein